MNKKTLKTLLGAAVATTIAGELQAAENPFAFKELDSGYVKVAEMGKDGKEMTCGEGKCGGGKMKQSGMNCGAMMQQKSEQSSQKAMEGKCAGMNMGGGQAAPASPPVPPAAEPAK